MTSRFKVLIRADVSFKSYLNFNPHYALDFGNERHRCNKDGCLCACLCNSFGSIESLVHKMGFMIKGKHTPLGRENDKRVPSVYEKCPKEDPQGNAKSI